MFLFSWLFLFFASADTPADWLLKNCTLVHGDHAETLKNKNIYLRDGKIIEISVSNQYLPAKNTLDCAGAIATLSFMSQVSFPQGPQALQIGDDLRAQRTPPEFSAEFFIQWNQQSHQDFFQEMRLVKSYYTLRYHKPIPSAFQVFRMATYQRHRQYKLPGRLEVGAPAELMIVAPPTLPVLPNLYEYLVGMASAGDIRAEFSQGQRSR